MIEQILVKTRREQPGGRGRAYYEGAYFANTARMVAHGGADGHVSQALGVQDSRSGEAEAEEAAAGEAPSGERREEERAVPRLPRPMLMMPTRTTTAQRSLLAG